MARALALRLAPAAAETPVTWREFIALPDDDRRELIDGRLVEIEVPTEVHEHIVMMLGFFLTAWAHARRAGRVLGSGYKVRISDKRGVMPDLQFYRRGNFPVGQPQGLAKGHPDLAVEIISPSSRRFDRVAKMTWYAAIGVPEYWIVDTDAQTLERLVLAGDTYRIAQAASGDEILRPKGWPGLAIPLALLWTLEGPMPPRKRPARARAARR